MVAKIEPEAVQVKKCVEAEVPTNTITQENGPLKELNAPTAAPSARRGSELAEKPATARDEDAAVGLKDDKQTGLLQCTLNSPQKEQDTEDLPEAKAAPEDMNSASAQDGHLDLNLPLPVEAAGLQNHTGIEAAAATAVEEKPSAAHSVVQQMGPKMDPADQEASRNCCEKNAASSASCQLLFVALVSKENESPSW